jgi:hypothetical protein
MADRLSKKYVDTKVSITLHHISRHDYLNNFLTMHDVFFKIYFTLPRQNLYGSNKAIVICEQ